MNKDHVQVGLNLGYDGVWMNQHIILTGLVPGIPNMLHGHHDRSGLNLGAATEETQDPGSWREERVAL